MGFVGSLAALFQRQKDDRKKICDIEKEMDGETEALRIEIKGLREDFRKDFRLYQQKFCQSITEVKALIAAGENRRNQAKSDLTAFREALVERLARMETMMEKHHK